MGSIEQFQESILERVRAAIEAKTVDVRARVRLAHAAIDAYAGVAIQRELASMPSLVGLHEHDDAASQRADRGVRDAVAALLQAPLAPAAPRPAVVTVPAPTPVAVSAPPTVVTPTVMPPPAPVVVVAPAPVVVASPTPKLRLTPPPVALVPPAPPLVIAPATARPVAPPPFSVPQPTTPTDAYLPRHVAAPTIGAPPDVDPVASGTASKFVSAGRETPSDWPRLAAIARLRPVLIVGGMPNNHRTAWLSDKLNGALVDWIETDSHNGIRLFQAAAARVANGSVACVLVLHRFISHKGSNVIIGACRATGTPYALAGKGGTGHLATALTELENAASPAN